MTTVLYTGDALCADRRIALPTKPTQFVDSGHKLFVAQNNRFAYAFTGKIPPRTSDYVNRFEDMWSNILVSLPGSPLADRGQLGVLMKGFDKLPEEPKRLAFGASMFVITRDRAYRLETDIKSELSDLGIPAWVFGSELESNLNTAKLSPWIFPLHGALGAAGSGGGVALGAWCATKDLDRTFKTTSQIDPLSSMEYETVRQCDLDYLAIG